MSADRCHSPVYGLIRTICGARLLSSSGGSLAGVFSRILNANDDDSNGRERRSTSIADCAVERFFLTNNVAENSAFGLGILPLQGR